MSILHSMLRNETLFCNRCVVRFENLFPFRLAFNAILDLLSVELSDFDVIE